MKGIAKLRRAMKAATAFEFERLVGDLLSALLLPTTLTRRLGRLDQLGIDAYVVGESESEFDIIIQCKGFEVIDYGKNQHRLCLRELKKYRSIGQKTKEYWLVLNRPVIDSGKRKELLEGLEALVRDGKAQEAHLLDLNHLEKMLRQLGSACLEKWANNKREEYSKFYRSHIEFVAPIRSVPFTTNNEGYDPAQYLFDHLEQFYSSLVDAKTGKNRHAPQFLVTSSFGFGKTTTLNLLAEVWLLDGQKLVYIPAAVMGDRAFAAAAGVAAEILNFLIPDDDDLPDLVYDFLRDILKSDLSKSKGWIVLIDGIDESPYSLNPNCITALSDGLRDIGIPAVLSARSELVETRPIEFTSGSDPSVPLPFIKLELQDWSDDLIIRFVSEFKQRQHGKIPDSFREFQDLIVSGRYTEFYADIPKRPLFLGMMVEDAWSGKQPERELHHLYGSYFRRKFRLDRFSLSAGGKSQRPSQIVDKFGMEEACERLIHIMQGTARKMASQFTDISDKQYLVVEQDVVTESIVAEIAASCGVPFAQIEDILLHSLLQPAGRNRKNRERQFRFAHRSFQDWFLARELVAQNECMLDRLPSAVQRFALSMRTDWENGIALP